ncbi:MAG TPA: hypothetical protein VLG09_00090 [Candidatus Saccharimonadales bacterium]|nr:hypothetical protein [Candidatus Saccharimonadales bacterium]
MSVGSERVKRWRDKNRALWNLRRRNARNKWVGLGCLEKESVVEATVARVEAAPKEIPGVRTRKVGEFRMIEIEPQKASGGEEKPAVDDSRTVKDVVGGIYRNDNGGVISKFAWEKLQRLKEHAKENNFEIDEYSQ